PRAAEVLAAALRRIPGITEARAKPVTGGLLVRHDARVRAADVGRIVRRAVALVAGAPAGAERPAPARAAYAPGRRAPTPAPPRAPPRGGGRGGARAGG
ncbi:ABC transporter ATP-binding protein, partial [Streptomyces olivaceus]